MTAPSIGLDVVAIIAAGHAETTATANSLIDNLMRECDQMRDDIDTVLARFGELFDSDYMPSTDAIFRALSPLMAYQHGRRYRGGDPS